MDAGRLLVVREALREAVGIRPGDSVDVTVHEAGLQVTVTERTAVLIEQDGELVAHGTTPVTDDDVLRLVDGQRQQSTHPWR